MPQVWWPLVLQGFLEKMPQRKAKRSNVKKCEKGQRRHKN